MDERYDELYVVARRVLLDALDALGPHRGAVILVGAHAVYLRVGEADLAVAPYTTDGDLAIDPTNLRQVPPLEEILMQAGFALKGGSSVGIWITHRPTSNSSRTEVGIDLLVPESLSPRKGHRAAGLLGHDARAARTVRGLDGVIADADIMKVTALDHADPRVFEIRIAGPAALLVAKVHKIRDRSGTSRSSEKDALDVLRLLRGVPIDDFANRMRTLLADDNARSVAEEALELFERQFGDRRGEGTTMAIMAVESLDDPEEIAASCEALAGDLIRALGR